MVKGITEGELRAKYSEVTQDLRRKIKILERELAEYKAAHGSISNLFGSIKDAICELPSVKIEYKPPKKKTKVETPCVVSLLISDTHYGAVQAKSEIEGFGEFSPEICEQRCMGFIEKVINWTEVHRTAYRIDEAEVLVAGDLISGDIHHELQVTNAFPVPVQVVRSARLLANQLSLLSRYFTKITVHFVTEDNHARLTKKPQAKEAGLNSFNYILGEIAALMVKGFKNIEFNIYPQYEVVVNVAGRRYLLTHGHNIRGWMGIPYYSVERKAAKEAIRRLNKPDYNRFDKIIMGHFHHPISHPVYWIGGSVSGTDAYDHKNGRYAEPSQTAWMVHPKRGEFDRTDFKL